MIRFSKPEYLKAVFKGLTDHPEELELGEALHPVKRLMRILEDIFDLLSDVNEYALSGQKLWWDILHTFNAHFPSAAGNHIDEWMLSRSGSLGIEPAFDNGLRDILIILEKRRRSNHYHNVVRDYERFVKILSSIRDKLQELKSEAADVDRFFGLRPRLENKQKILPKWRKALPNFDPLVVEREELLKIADKIITMMKRGCNTKLEWDAYFLFALLVEEKFIYHPRYSSYVLDIYYHWDEFLSPDEMQDHWMFDAREYVDTFMDRERPLLRRWAQTGDASILADIEERIVKTPYMTCLYGHLFQKRAEALWHPGELRSGKWVGQGAFVRKRLEEIKEFNAKAEELTKAHKREQTIQQ